MLMYESGIIYFSGFDSNTTKPHPIQLLKKILIQKERPKEITLIINPTGGEVHSAFALIDTMKGFHIPAIKTVGLGMIAARGILTFMAGTKGPRVITPTHPQVIQRTVGVVLVKNMSYLQE